TLFGRSTTALVLSQAAVDLGTCLLAAKLAVELVPDRMRQVVWIVALWLGVTCPFVANYTAVALTEVLVAFVTVAALLCFVLGLKEEAMGQMATPKGLNIKPIYFSALGAFSAGLATLCRPEMPLLLIAASGVYALRWWKEPGIRTIGKLALVM